MWRLILFLCVTLREELLVGVVIRAVGVRVRVRDDWQSAYAPPTAVTVRKKSWPWCDRSKRRLTKLSPKQPFQAMSPPSAKKVFTSFNMAASGLSLVSSMSCWVTPSNVHVNVISIVSLLYRQKNSVVKSRWLCYFQESRSTCQKFYFLESSSVKILHFLESRK